MIFAPLPVCECAANTILLLCHKHTSTCDTAFLMPICVQFIKKKPYFTYACIEQLYIFPWHRQQIEESFIHRCHTFYSETKKGMILYILCQSGEILNSYIDVLWCKIALHVSQVIPIIHYYVQHPSKVKVSLQELFVRRDSKGFSSLSHYHCLLLTRRIGTDFICKWPTQTLARCLFSTCATAWSK